MVPAGRHTSLGYLRGGPWGSRPETSCAGGQCVITCSQLAAPPSVRLHRMSHRQGQAMGPALSPDGRGTDTQGTAGTGGCQPAVNILSLKLLMQRPVVGAANGPCDTQEAPAWVQMAWSHRKPLLSQSLGSTEGWEDPMGPSSSPIKSPRAAAGCCGEGHQVASPGLPARQSAPQTVGFHSSWAVEGVRRTRCPCMRPSGAMDPDLWPLHGPRALLSLLYL